MSYGYYYLHANGEMIFKKFEPESDSPFVVKVWRVNAKDRGNAWLICIEGLALGAKKEAINRLAMKWGLTDEDAPNFIKHATDDEGNELFKLWRDGDQWTAAFHDFVNLQESQVGFGPTALQALAELAKPGLIEKFGRATG